MSKTSTDPERLALNGPAMGARWSAVLHVGTGADPARLHAALAAAVAEVEAQMTTRRVGSDLMRLNRAEPDRWIDLPAGLVEVLAAGLAIGRASGGAFEIGLGDAVAAWGFSGDAADPGRIRAALKEPRRPACEVLELDCTNRRARKHGTLALDLCGIAKGYGVDRLAETARDFGIESALLSIDGELRALGPQPGGRPWAVAVERPDPGKRAAHAVLALESGAVATSGDYRHWVDLGGRRLSHTMDPRRRAPLAASPASVTVLGARCMEADAWATALMVLGREEGAALARRLGLSALFLERDGAGLVETAIGPGFAA
ncbi:FAD:protein FMN transferase [Rhodovulum kholense]|uniref:FAD:protein FMN transferase n=1 Tax=Rhodovulum kholense TaxID=453584 RepID=A0A8E2VJJ1_9RHOB|nr:FAD:protein FMN transferase [Rhodovulum kholense]PTW46083.1 thiamine biosynthesis lipoprotein [Rhodovulum kholense]